MIIFVYFKLYFQVGVYIFVIRMCLHLDHILKQKGYILFTYPVCVKFCSYINNLR